MVASDCETNRNLSFSIGEFHRNAKIHFNVCGFGHGCLFVECKDIGAIRSMINIVLKF